MTSPSDPVGPAHATPDELSWTWQRGGSATVVRVDGLHVEVHSTTPYPPGAPLVARSNSGTSFEVKVRGCRKLPSGAFAISGSLVNLTRDLRVALSDALTRASHDT